MFFKTTVHIKSIVPGLLWFYFRFGDDDFGNRTFNTGEYYNFHFHPIYSTRFYCHIYWNLKDTSFGVYSHSLESYCDRGYVNYDCFWHETPLGFDIGNNHEPYQIGLHAW